MLHWRCRYIIVSGAKSFRLEVTAVKADLHCDLMGFMARLWYVFALIELLCVTFLTVAFVRWAISNDVT